MKFLRTVAGYRLTDKRSNKDIKEELSMWLATALNRMEEDEIPYKLLHYCPTGRISGCTAKRQKDQYDSDEPEGGTGQLA